MNLQQNFRSKMMLFACSRNKLFSKRETEKQILFALICHYFPLQKIRLEMTVIVIWGTGLGGSLYRGLCSSLLTQMINPIWNPISLHTMLIHITIKEQ